MRASMEFLSPSKALLFDTVLVTEPVMANTSSWNPTSKKVVLRRPSLDMVAIWWCRGDQISSGVQDWRSSGKAGEDSYLKWADTRYWKLDPRVTSNNIHHFVKRKFENKGQPPGERYEWEDGG